MDDDRREIRFLVESQAERLQVFKRWLEKHPENARPSAMKSAFSMVTNLELEINSLIQGLESEPLTELLARVRVIQSLVGAVCASLDWQSPSFLHSLHSEAGTQTGRIVGTISDYKRDHHFDAEEYGHQFVKEYVDKVSPLPVQSFVTSSGMAAFTSLVVGLQMAGVLPGQIVLGQSCYFESKMVLTQMFPGLITEVDELNTQEILSVVKEKQPAVIFLDTLCNTADISMPDLGELLPALAAACSRKTYLVLDNSGLGPACQPLKHLPFFPTKLKTYVFESLNKHHQFGLDRVTGGVIWTQEVFSGWLANAIMHLGTNIPDASALSLPSPSRQMLDARLQRIGRNASRVAAALSEYIQARPTSPISSVVYPGLIDHPANSYARHLLFSGASLVIKFKDDQNTVRLAKSFIEIAIKEAHQEGIDLTAGTSFGLNTTRVYLTALYGTSVTRPFLRISVGTEPVGELDKLIKVFERTIDTL